jgi:hypothetical protein
MRPVPKRYAQFVYIGGILVLFLAMAFYRGALEERKREQKLGEATIGQVDTGSFMLKLALLGGARGVAANVLWVRAEDLKKAHEWDRLKTTVDLITKLQPHFLSIWTFQGWNLAYNVSVEWDSPDDKYEWIKQGIKFLKEGVKKNETSPDLVWDTAWTYYHKIGFADEAIILRRLFRDDDDEEFRTYYDLRERVPYTRNDNFQLGYGWFSNAVEMVDRGAQRLAVGRMEQDVEYVDKPLQHKGKPGDLAFRTMPGHAQSRYAAGLEKESVLGIPATFGEVAPIEWARAHKEWEKFGTYPFAAHNDPDHTLIYIDDHTNSAKMVSDRMEQVPGAGEKFRLAAPNDDKAKLDPKMAHNARHWTERWSNQTNYRYWKDRAAAEGEPAGVRARRYFYEGTKALKAGRLISEKDKNGQVREGAVDNYKKGLDEWKALLDRHRDYRDDELNMKDTGLIVKRYAYALRQIGKEPPDDMPFKDLLQRFRNDHGAPDPFDALEMIKTAPAGSARSAR